MTTIMLQTLNKVYHGGVYALNNVDLTIPPGMFGLLGPNGAGKTTLMRILAGIVRPTSGTIRIGAHDGGTERGRTAVKRMLGYLPQDFGVYPDLNAREFLDYIAILKGLRDRILRHKRIEALLEIVSLTQVANRKLKTYSGGMKRRIGIAQALIALLLNVAVFLTFRMGIRLWLFWNRLRHRQLLWALTYAHVMILLLGAGLLVVVIEALVIYYSPDVFLVVSTTLGLIVLSLIALLVVLPLSALFSYLVIRRTVQRLQTLATATGALRRGDYAIRVPVNGEDEVAQLQADFNGMAADLERAVRELQGERDRVASLLQERREMIATVSHELRTPVATLRGYLETMLLHWGEPASATFHHDLEVMEHEVEHLQFLVEDLFTLARTDVGRLALQCEPADIGKIVRRVVESMAPLAWRTSKIEMVAEVPPELPLAAVDANRLEQALQNLLHNAMRHTAPGGIIAVAVMTEPETLVLQVRDTGEGIAPEDLPRIWERFYQAGSTPARAGTGLGLSLVKEWIEAMGGSVAVESVQGEGSCFTLHLPQSSP